MQAKEKVGKHSSHQRGGRNDEHFHHVVHVLHNQRHNEPSHNLSTNQNPSVNRKPVEQMKRTEVSVHSPRLLRGLPQPQQQVKYHSERVEKYTLVVQRQLHVLLEQVLLEDAGEAGDEAEQAEQGQPHEGQVAL